MAIRIIITDSSIWTLDYKEMRFRRDPRVQGTEHPMLSYDETQGWIEFVSLEEIGTQWEDRIRFSVYGHDLDGHGSGYITSTYKPGEQNVWH